MLLKSIKSKNSKVFHFDQEDAMLMKYEELLVELTSQVGLLYHRLNFSNCFLCKWDGITCRHMIQMLYVTTRPFTDQGHKVSKLHLDPENTIIWKFLCSYLYVWGNGLTSISTYVPIAHTKMIFIHVATWLEFISYMCINCITNVT